MIYLRGPHLGPAGTSWRPAGRRRRGRSAFPMIALVGFLTWPVMIGWLAEVIWLPAAIVITGAVIGLRRR